MKAIILSVLVVILCDVKCELKSDDDRFMASALRSILESYFAPRSAKVDVFYYGVKGGLSETIAEHKFHPAIRQRDQQQHAVVARAIP